MRFPPGMREFIQRAARQNGRSMNQEILARLQSTMTEPIRDGDRDEALRSVELARACLERLQRFLVESA